MIARGFKPVGWVAAIGGAALGCYMLSLNVAAERAELAKVEREIVMAKREIRSLQTELGTRGRMQQLEQWNAEVLALSAPTSAQFLADAVTLARFETHEPTVAERAPVRMASMETQSKARPAELAPADYAAAAALAAKEPKPLVHRASFVTGPASQVDRPEQPAPAPKKMAAPKSAAPVAKPAAPVPVQKFAEAKPVKTVPTPQRPARSTRSGMLDENLLDELRDAAKFEKAGAGAGGQ